MPDLNESVVHWGAAGSVHDSEVHEELYSPIAVVMRTERPRAYEGAYVCDSLMS